MKVPVRPLTVSLCLVGSLAVASAAYPSLVEEMASDLWNVNEYQSEYDQAVRDRRELDRDSGYLMTRIEMKMHAIDALIEGRSAFAETVETFRTANRDFRVRVDESTPRRGACDRQRAAWQVVEFLRSRHTPEADAIAARHEPELLAGQ